MPTEGWVIVLKATGEAVCQLWGRSAVEKINTAKYRAVPTREYLYALNAKIAADERTRGTR